MNMSPILGTISTTGKGSSSSTIVFQGLSKFWEENYDPCWWPSNPPEVGMAVVYHVNWSNQSPELLYKIDIQQLRLTLSIFYQLIFFPGLKHHQEAWQYEQSFPLFRGYLDILVDVLYYRSTIGIPTSKSFSAVRGDSIWLAILWEIRIPCMDLKNVPFWKDVTLR